MTEENEMNMDTLSPQGFPYCPNCGSTLYWECNNMPDELGYCEEGESDCVVHTLHCPECDKSYEVGNDGCSMNLLCVITPTGEDEEPDIEYTEYALNKYSNDKD